MLVRVRRDRRRRPLIHPGIGQAPGVAPRDRSGDRRGVRTGGGQGVPPGRRGARFRAAQEGGTQLGGGGALAQHPGHIGAVHQPAAGDQRPLQIPAPGQQFSQRRAGAARVGTAPVATGLLALQHDGVDAILRLVTGFRPIGGGADQADAPGPAGVATGLVQAPEGEAEERRPGLEHGLELFVEAGQLGESLRQATPAAS